MDNRDFKISLRELEKEFLCNVCFNEIEDCYITRCGHVHCKKCIFQTINRHHRQLAEADVFKNYHFNTLRKVLDKEKTEAAAKYLEKVFQYEQMAEEVLLAPIQKALHENYKNTLLTYRKYTKELYENMQKAEEKRAREKKSNHNMKTLDQIIKQIQQILIPHVSTSLVQPTLVPQTFTVTVALNPAKSISLATPVSGLTPVSTLLSQLQVIMKQNNSRLELKQPQSEARVTINQFQYKLSDVIGDNIQFFWNRPLVVAMGPGASIVRNAECFTYKWGVGKKTNYFSCKDCKINWICETCKDYCHQGHAVSDQLKDQSPNWSCCYCVTKATCRALNKNS